MDKPTLVLGTMSGTSCDGLDLVLCSIGNGGREVRLEEVAEEAYPEEWADRLRALRDLPEVEVQRLEEGWTRWVAGAIERVLLRWDLRHGRPALLGFSGHTWYHEPGGRGTAAIGDAVFLSATLGLPVVADYRSADVAAGGQGAPLVPLFDAQVFRGHAGCVNLGGIVNLTILPSGSDEVRAWDVAGCNLLLNAQSRRLGLGYDAGGEAARQGRVDLEALAGLEAWPYLSRPAPKSLAAEDLDPLHRILDKVVSPRDALATCVEWIARSVADAMRQGAAGGRVLLTGGGAHNTQLVERMAHHLDPGWTVEVPTAEWVDGKEAAAFAWLAWRTAHGLTTSLSSVTGAREDVKGGTLYGTFAPSGGAMTRPDDA